MIIAIRILGTEVLAFDLTTAQQERELAEREDRASKATGLPFGFSGGSHVHLETDYRDTSEEVQA